MSRASDDDRYINIHARLCSDDPTAFAELAPAVFDRLVNALARRNPGIQDRALIIDAVVDALLAYAKQPSSYDPGKAGLIGYLEMAAQGDLKNSLAKLSRRRRKEKSLENVEVVEFRGKEVEKVADPADMLDAESLRGKLDQLFDDPVDRELVDLVVEKERSTSVFSEVLGIEHLPPVEQRRVVKRHKDRIKKRLERLGKSMRDETE